MESATLGALVDRAGGLLQTGPFGTQLHASDYTERGVAVVMPQDIRGGYVDHSEIARVPHTVAAGLSRHELREGDIVYSRRGDVEKCAYVRAEDLPALCGTGCLLVRTVPAADVDPRFLGYRLQAPETKAWIRNHAVGATMPNLNTAILRSVPLEMPTLPEQEAIAEVLGALDDKIAANAALVRTTTELAQALTRRALTSGALGTLGEIASITMGSSPKGTSYNEGGGGVTMYQGTRDFGVRFPSPRVWTTEPLRLADAGDVLISVRAPVGSLNVADVECCIGRGLAAAKSETPSSVYHLLSAQPEVFASFNSDGTIFGSISKQQLHELSLKLPADLAALEFELQPLEALVAATLRESQTLAELRDTLLPALMDGTIRVKDAISQAEEVL